MGRRFKVILENDGPDICDLIGGFRINKFKQNFWWIDMCKIKYVYFLNWR